MYIHDSHAVSVEFRRGHRIPGTRFSIANMSYHVGAGNGNRSSVKVQELITDKPVLLAPFIEFADTVSCIQGGIKTVGQGDLEVTSTSQMLGLQVCVTMPSFCDFFLSKFVISL